MKVKDRIQKHVANLADPDKKVASRAERILMRWYGDRAFSQLIEACDHPNPSVRFRAVWALAHTKNPKAFETVLRLTDDPDEAVRYDATLALGKLGDERAIEQLVRIARECDDTRPALGVLRDFGLKAVQPYSTFLCDADAGFREGAVDGIGYLARKYNSQECFDIFRECLLDPDETVRGEARFWFDGGFDIVTEGPA